MPLDPMELSPKFPDTDASLRGQLFTMELCDSNVPRIRCPVASYLSTVDGDPGASQSVYGSSRSSFSTSPGEGLAKSTMVFYLSVFVSYRAVRTRRVRGDGSLSRGASDSREEISRIVPEFDGRCYPEFTPLVIRLGPLTLVVDLLCRSAPGTARSLAPAVPDFVEPCRYGGCPPYGIPGVADAAPVGGALQRLPQHLHLRLR